MRFPRPTPRPGPIVVGIDGSAGSQRALEWAVVRAAAGQTSLRIVHAVGLPEPMDPCGYACWWDPGLVENAHEVLEGAARAAHAQAPELLVTTSLLARAPAVALLREGRLAELIVLGRSRPGRLGFRIRSVNAAVVRGARGRVVIVGPDDEESA